jgi:hypothetical protein
LEHIGAAEPETRAGYELAIKGVNPWYRGMVAYWLWRMGGIEAAPDNIAEPYRLQIEGDRVGAAAAWERLNSPYERALALAATDDTESHREALDQLERLGAHGGRRDRPRATPGPAKIGSRSFQIRQAPPIRCDRRERTVLPGVHDCTRARSDCCRLPAGCPFWLLIPHHSAVRAATRHAAWPAARAWRKEMAQTCNEPENRKPSGEPL